MIETPDQYAERTRPSRTHGWLHAVDATGGFSSDKVAELSATTIGDVIALTADQADEICPSVSLDPAVDARNAIEECDITAATPEAKMGVLLYLDVVEGTSTASGAQFVIRAIHHPRDIYGRRGTPLREAVEILEAAGFNFPALHGTRARLLHEKGIEHGDLAGRLRRGDAYWVTTYRGGVEAARAALAAAGMGV